MSVLVMGMCFRVTFGNAWLKAVAVALADHAHDDGTNIWPSVAKLAGKTEIAERTVQYKLRELEQCGLIVCVDEGGAGPKDTREYKFDMKLLRRLSDGEAEIVINKGARDAPLEGAPDAPLDGARVHATTIRVHPTTEKGAPGAPEPSLTIKEPSLRASAREDSISDFEKVKEQPQARPALVIKHPEAAFAEWLKWLGDRDPELADKAEAAGELTAASRWPRDDSPKPIVPKVARLSLRSKAIIGEAAE